jgi:hypothetical protein
MIPEKAKLLSAFIKDTNAKSVTTSLATQNLKHDTLIKVEVLETVNSFKVTDGPNIISCKISKEALFWFKMNNDNRDLKGLKGECLALCEYGFGSVLRDQNELEIFLEVYSFMLLPKEEAKGINFSKTPKSLLQDPKAQHGVEALRIYHLRKAISRRPIEVPNLEELLGVESGKGSKKKVEPFINDLKSENEKRSEGKDKIIEPENLKNVEKKISKDVAIIFEQDKKIRSKVKEGSEGNLEADTMLSKVQNLIKDKAIVEMLKDHGTFTRRRVASKSPVKRGKMSTELEKIVEILKEDKTGRKRKALGEDDISKKPEKRRAIEVEGKKVSSRIKRKTTKT